MREGGGEERRAAGRKQEGWTRTYMPSLPSHAYTPLPPRTLAEASADASLHMARSAESVASFERGMAQVRERVERKRGGR